MRVMLLYLLIESACYRITMLRVSIHIVHEHVVGASLILYCDNLVSIIGVGHPPPQTSAITGVNKVPTAVYAQ